jgi:hypothetical protein
MSNSFCVGDFGKTADSSIEQLPRPNSFGFSHLTYPKAAGGVNQETP